MKHSILFSLLIIATFLQSCDERIAPANTKVEVKVLTKTELLTGNSWQYSQVIVRGGGQTVVQFSRANSTSLTSEISTQKDTYKIDGSYDVDKKGVVKSGTWKLSSDEKQLFVTDSKGKHTLDIVSLTQDKFEFNETVKKADIGIDALWAELLRLNGLPATVTEFTTSFSQIPI